MTDGWFVSANNQVYGPYSLDQMRGYVAEGRVGANALVRAGTSGAFVEAAKHAALERLFAVGAKAPAPAETRRASFVIIAELRAASCDKFEDALHKLGPSYRLNQFVWLQQSDLTVGAIRNTLMPLLGKADTLLVIEGAKGKTSSYNFGPQAEAQIKSVWHKAEG
jgi:hypothetical protein